MVGKEPRGRGFDPHRIICVIKEIYVTREGRERDEEVLRVYPII